MVRIKDVAEAVGVSTATVSNVINGKDQRVSGEVRERIQKALDEMGYVRNRSAMMLAQTNSNMIGVVIPDKPGTKITMEDPYFSALVGNLEAEIRAHDCYMYLIAQQREEEILKQAIAWNLEGLIVCNLVEPQLRSLCEKYRGSVVSIDSYLNRKANFVNIATDDFGGGYKMGKYLIRQGHTKIAMLADNDQDIDHYRWMGLQRAMEEEGLVIKETDHFVFSASESARELELNQWLPMLKEYTALFVASDLYALEVSSFLQSRGLRIPEDISVAGFDDLIYARLARPKLTTINQNIGKKAQMAVEALLALRDKNVDQVVQEPHVLPVRLVERESVGRISCGFANLCGGGSETMSLS